MANGIYTALSGAMADVKRMELVSHNLANVSTPAFNQFRMVLEAVKGEANSKEVTFVKPAEIERDTQSGPLRATGNPLDIALTSGVYMAVKNGDKTAYVRGATLVPQPDGTLVTQEGHPVLGKADLIRLPPGTNSVTVAPDGTVTADDRNVDKLRLTEFDDQQALAQGSKRTFFDPGGAGAIPTQTARPIAVGYVEESNINLITGMTEMIAAHRNYDTMIKSIQTLSKIESRAARDLAGRMF
ncbi:MAG: flagellar hook basal-body protein [Proteobacteria bacterium]|nr:flagellar hook basal-body protein [Pseudomonadota bacterium]